MKYVALIAFLASSGSVFATSLEVIALERLQYEVQTTEDSWARASSAQSYFSDLTRLGLKPRSEKDCVSEALMGSISSPSCLAIDSVEAVIKEGGGTGGVD